MSKLPRTKNEEVIRTIYGDVLDCIRQNLGLEYDDSSRDAEIAKMPAAEMFERFMTWNSIIGFEDEILTAVREIDRADKIRGGEGLLT